MEGSVEAVPIVAPKPDPVSPTPDEISEGQTDAPPEAQAAAPGSTGDTLGELSKRLEDILCTYGSAASLLDKQTAVMAPEKEKMAEKSGDDVTVTTGTEPTVLMQGLDKLSSPDEKLEALVKMYVELAEVRHMDERKLCDLQQKLSCLSRDQEQLQTECHRGLLARRELEELCQDLHKHNRTLKEETLRRRREDEEKRQEITSHFQKTLTEIQAQIEQHSSRNTKLYQENAYLADKLESLMNQYERREESLEKVGKHRELQQKLTDTKLEQANALLAEAEEKHRREKEYLLVQAAEWKLQAQQLREQGTLMQAQLTLYSQKFDDFQITLAKSNDIFVTFKQEMEKMSKKMKTLEKESGIWKTRFESCNKALADMIEERSEKGKEFDLFVLKIQKLETLCRALQDERKCLYEKIKEVRYVNSGLSSKLPATETPSQDEPTVLEDTPKSPPTASAELLEEDQVLTENMARLKAEQARLQEFAAALLSSSADSDDDGNNLDPEEDVLSSALVQFTQQTQLNKEPREISAPEQVEEKPVVDQISAKPVPSEQVKAEQVHNQAEGAPTQVCEATQSLTLLEAPQQNSDPASFSTPVESKENTSSTSPEASNPQPPTDTSKEQLTKKNIKKTS
ncbi:beta-taxilin-like isoform X2 [Lampris incognitus]|uniref:beta-taxilin-like isoform X2 n=1 Tax=Lampris incognitus TaxID=2546036 RepID=UPI0024B5237F|nr:beta-taxilin-like isoform X2 [Lampris incognitus]